MSTVNKYREILNKRMRLFENTDDVRVEIGADGYE